MKVLIKDQMHSNAAKFPKMIRESEEFSQSDVLSKENHSSDSLDNSDKYKYSVQNQILDILQ